MKKWLLLALLVTSTPSFALELWNYWEVKSAAMAGKQLHFVVNLLKCTAHTSNMPLTDGTAIAIYTPNEMDVMSDHMATSVTHFTLQKQPDPTQPPVPVYEFARYTLTPDDNMNIAVWILDVNHNVTPSHMTFDCKINDAAKVYM
jgi:hypothetical protein